MKILTLNIAAAWGLITGVLLVGLASGLALVQTPDYEQTSVSRDELAQSPRHMEYVTYADDTGGSVTSFLVYPESNRAADSVVIAFTGWAMTPWIQVIADRLARDGFATIVPDMLSGYGPGGGNSDSFESKIRYREGYPGRFDEADDVRRAMGSLDEEEIQGRLTASVRYMRALSATTDTVSVVGFCWGGTRAFEFATREPSLKAAFVFYGSPPAKEAVANIACPVYGFYGENDFRVNVTIEETKIAMAAAGKLYEPVVYKGVGHGFVQAGTGDRVILNSQGADAAVQQTREAWDRLVTLLRR